MITGLQLDNFKCFQQSPVFEFSKLNLLTGINGRGKSTVLQSLLLLIQSKWHDSEFGNLIINGDLVELGNFEDVKNSATARREHIKFHLKTNDIGEAIFLFQENVSNPLIADISKLGLRISNNVDFEYHNGKHYHKFKDSYNRSSWGSLQLLFGNVYYVAADRMGPVKYVDKTYQPNIHSDPKGEFTINFLANDNLSLVHKDLYLGKDAQTVIQQTQEWLGYILDGSAKIEILGRERESNTLSLWMNNRNNTNKYRQANMGFGYSYILPLIFTGLIAKPGEMIIIENPEAHLHPRAQSRITEFFAKVAATGVQVFIESHSEHILNGLRLSALKPDIAINNTDLSILYFNENFTCEKMVVDEKGKIGNWPDGFFDQQEIDLSNIFKYSR